MPLFFITRRELRLLSDWSRVEYGRLRQILDKTTGRGNEEADRHRHRRGVVLLTLTAVSSAGTADLIGPLDSSGVLVRHDDGYIITGTLRDADSHVATFHGRLIELTTGFNSCPDLEFSCFFGGNTPTCNLLSGELTFNLGAETFNDEVDNTINGRLKSSLCKDSPDATIYRSEERQRDLIGAWQTPPLRPVRWRPVSGHLKKGDQE
jgi:hypothetical protein